MKKILFLVSGFFLLICACNNPSKTRTNSQELAVVTEDDAIKVYRVLLPDDSGMIYLDFQDGEVKERIRKDSMQTVIVVFNPGDSTTLKGWLSSKDSAANIRFDQIVLPDSTMDGPFGQEIEYKLNQRGNYKLLIGENMMAGDPWEGEFLLKMKLMK